LSLILRKEHRLRVFEKRVVRGTFEPRKDGQEGTKLYNEELHNLTTSPSIIRMTKSKRVRWAGHVARMVRREMHIEYCLEHQKERAH
jgi:hypothetical protein